MMLSKKILGIGFCTILLLILTSTSMGVTSSQWFPQAGTNCTYSVTWYVDYKNGTKLSDSSFDVYNDSGTILYVPSLLDQDNYTKSVHPSYTQLVVGASLTYTHAYTELSGTTLGRSLSIKAQDLSISNKPVWIVPSWFGSVPYVYVVNTTDDSVQKQGYFTSAFDFLDFINFALQPVDTFLSPHSKISTPFFSYMTTAVIAKTDSQIVALWKADYSGVWFNATYIADASGRVSSYTYVYHDEPNLGNQVSYSISFVRLPDGIPGYSFVWILAAMGIGTLVLVEKKRFNAKRN